MSDALSVILNNQIAGTIIRSSNSTIRFEYEEDYRNQSNPTPLSVAMPTSIKTHPHSVISPWLWGLLPENQIVLDRWARKFQVSSSSPFELLKTPIGEDCPGAVRFVSPDRVKSIINAPSELLPLSDEEVGKRLRDLLKDSATWLGESYTGRFSLAGAQAKTALVRTENGWALPVGSMATTHILKPGISDYHDHEINEYLCLNAARLLGLRTAKTSLERISGVASVVSDRYDRYVADGIVKRIHQEDLCQALGIIPAKKYQNEGGPSPLDIVKLLRRALAPTAAEVAILNFVDALIWNWFIGGTDAHAKNYSILILGQEVRFAPLYDVASALPYDDHEKKLRFAMKLGGSYGVWIDRNPWPSVAKELDLGNDLIVSRAQEIGDRIANSFEEVSRRSEVADLASTLPSRLLEKINERSKRCMTFLK